MENEKTTKAKLEVLFACDIGVGELNELIVEFVKKNKFAIEKWHVDFQEGTV